MPDDTLSRGRNDPYVPIRPNSSLTATSAQEALSKEKKSVWAAVKSILPFLILIFGMIGLFLPIAADMAATRESNATITSMSSAYDPLSDPRRIACLENAQEYNKRLGGEQFDTSKEISEYDDQLFYKGVPQMSWIEIPKISVKLPIYHGTSDAALSAGVGHLADTSLPVGGASSHCVLTGHTGMQSERMFDDIRKLEEGDIFVLHTLGDPYAYKVVGTEVVEPQEVESLSVEPGRDLVTLVTCTPYGVNTHRLLVHAERTNWDDQISDQVTTFATYANERTPPFIIGIAAGLICLIAIAILRLITWKRKKAAQDAEKETHQHLLDRNTSYGKEALASRISNPFLRFLYLAYPFLFMFAGLIGLAVPMLMDMQSNAKMQTIITSMSSEIGGLSDETKMKILDDADNYNAELARFYANKQARSENSTVDDNSKSDNEDNLNVSRENLAYNDQLNILDTGEMSSVEIPKIGVSLPIYHGTDETVLALGAGHLEGTSLPVGGESTHAVVSAHSGLAEARMFDDLRELEEGDVFIFRTLDQPYAYKVTSVETVLPSEIESLTIQEGKDLATLITCTPYGVNTHRLLVHGERISRDEEQTNSHIEERSTWTNIRVMQFAIASGVVIIVLGGLGTIRLIRLSRMQRTS